MSKKDNSGGFYISYYNKKGELKKGAVHYSEQPEAFKRQGRFMVRCLNADMTPEKDPLTNKNLVSIVTKESIKQTIGFFD